MAVVIELHTLGINLDMDALCFLNKYIELSSESPVARYLTVTANLPLAGTARRKEVFFREIAFSVIIHNRA
jgi:hypothetical protein